MLNGLGLSITPMLTALGVGGLAVALALQDTLANLFAGVYITIAGQIRVGDYLRLDSGQEGYVADIGWRSTRIRMLPNNLVLVPNAKLSQAIVTNYYLPDRELAVLVEVGVDYGSDLAPRGTGHVRSRERDAAERSGRRRGVRPVHPLSHVRRFEHQLHRDPPGPRVRGSVPAQA